MNDNDTDKITSNKLWLSVSQSAKLCGVEQKTIRRAIKAHQVSYAVRENRYTIETGSLIAWAHQSVKLKNKLNQVGIGKFVKEWKETFIKNAPTHY